MKYQIALLPGDGIGPEVMTEAKNVLHAVATRFGHDFQYQEALIGGAAYEVHEDHFPEETQKICQQSDAILFGSVGGPITEMDQPKWNNCEKNSILGLRKSFQFNANFRPVKVYPQLKEKCPLKDELIEQGIDILFVRELVGGIYFGEHHSEGEKGHRKAHDIMEYQEDQIVSIARTAFEAAQKRGKKLHSVDKSNVLDCSKLWKTIVEELSQDYPDVALEHILVDNCAMQIIKNPAQFDVILCPNMFGDILSDAGAVLPGSLGLMPSASFSSNGFAMYEPSGGSAPDIAGKNVANPLAQILSAALMLRYSFGLEEEALAIEQAVNTVLEQGLRTGDIALPHEESISTSMMGAAISEALSS